MKKAIEFLSTALALTGLTADDFYNIKVNPNEIGLQGDYSYQKAKTLHANGITCTTDEYGFANGEIKTEDSENKQYSIKITLT